VVNGLTVTSASNTLDETLEGLTLELKGTTEPGAPITVTVGQDRAAVREALEEFVQAYNGVVGTVRDLSRFNPETRRARCWSATARCVPSGADSSDRPVALRHRPRCQLHQPREPRVSAPTATAG
jgi:hypothetical protein